jgi:hypothetical protein
MPQNPRPVRHLRARGCRARGVPNPGLLFRYTFSIQRFCECALLQVYGSCGSVQENVMPSCARHGS